MVLCPYSVWFPTYCHPNCSKIVILLYKPAIQNDFLNQFSPFPTNGTFLSIPKNKHLIFGFYGASFEGNQGKCLKIHNNKSVLLSKILTFE